MLFKSFLKSYRTWIVTIFAVMVLSFMAACGGGAASETSSLSADNEAPSINITSPTPGGSQSQAILTNLSATATDQEDGDISSNIEWLSDIDGTLGIGSNISVQLTNGDHTITATITDSGAKSAETVINYEVKANYGVATLSWTAPTQNTDDSNLTDLAGFKVYYGNSEQNLSMTLNISNSTISSVVIENLTVDETYYFGITAVNELGIESELSQTVSKFVQG